MEFLKSLDAVQIQAYLALIILVVGLIESIVHKHREAKLLDEKDRKRFYWNSLKELAPKAMLVVERGVRLTETKSDDAFVEVMKRMAKAAGLKIVSDDIEAVKDLGTAEKEAFKASQLLIATQRGRY